MKIGPFQLLAQVAATSDGVAYRALDPRDNQPVELRVLAGARGDVERWNRRTKRLRLAALVDHPAARRIRALRLHCQPFYVAVEWLDGPSLARQLEGALPLPAPQVIAWGRGLATALAAGHRMGIAHGELGPAGLRCTKTRVPKIDFTGFSADPGEESAALDARFRAPELRSSLVPDFAADVYSLGCLLGWLLTGQVPTVEREPPCKEHRDSSAMEDLLDELLRSMRAADPAERPSARAVEERLAALMPSGKTVPPVAVSQLLATNLVAPEEVGQAVELRPEQPVLRDRLGRYRLKEKLGEGGMGEVWRGEDPTDQTTVAIKVLRPDWARKPEALRRFLKEARLLGEVNHPNVANLLEVNEDAGIHYLVLEYVAGTTLDKVIQERGKLEERAALQIVADVARALEEAHRRRIVHRDIKPANIVLSSVASGQSPVVKSGTSAAPDDLQLATDDWPLTTVKLLDFGLARHVVQTESLNITSAGTMLGTPLYMAPEQGLGRATDARTDVYALGATLFHLLAGQPPFQAENAFGLLTMHASEPPPPLRSLNPAVSEGAVQVVEKCLAKAPEARYADAGDLLRDLERLLRGEPTTINIHPLLPAGDPARVRAYEWSWDLAAMPAQLWPYVSNTERLNRAIGLPGVNYTTAADAGGVKRFGQFRARGLNIAWREHPFEWVEGRRMGVLREYSEGVFRWLQSIVELEARPGGGTRLSHRIRLEPKGWLGRFVAAVEVGVRARKGLERVYRHIDAFLTGQLGDPALADAFETTSPLSGSGRRRLRRLLDQLIRDGCDPLAVERFGEFLATAPAQEVARIRPLALARRLGLDADQVVTVCLRGARAGLLVLLWDVLCPVCRIPSDVKDTLRALKEHDRCEACNLNYELDFANSVELIFRVHPEVRASELAMYCIGGPAHSPHVAAQVRLAAGEHIALELALNEGAYRLRGPQLPWALDFQVGGEAPARRWDVPLSRGLDPIYPRRLPAGPQVLALTNDCAQELVVRLERTAPRADALTAARASALALFRELFPAEVLSPGQLISVTTVTLLATRLEGGRDLYRELGDAKAFAVIHEHFQHLNDCIRREGGALIKTVGEGLLAAFPQTAAAVRAGLDLPGALAGSERTRSLQLRVSVHSGPAMAATLNGQLDYFGLTVRVVEQLLSHVPAGALILTPNAAADPQVAEWLARHGLKGDIVAVEVPDLDAGPAACLLVTPPAGPVRGVPESLSETSIKDVVPETAKVLDESWS